MRFKPYGRSQFEDTSRKRALAARKQRLEREACPLFAGQIEAEQPSLDEIMDTRAARWERTEQDRRDFHAEVWRRSRRRFYALPAEQRKELRAAWAVSWAPAASTHFAGFLDLHIGPEPWED